MGRLGYFVLAERGRDALERVKLGQTFRDTLASLRVLAKRILRRHGYPPDKEEKAAQTVLEQAECCRRPGPHDRPGLDEPDRLGSDSMQALCLALCSAGRLMRDLQEAGVVFTDRGEDIAFDWTDYFDLFPASDEQR